MSTSIKRRLNGTSSFPPVKFSSMGENVIKVFYLIFTQESNENHLGMNKTIKLLSIKQNFFFANYFRNK